MKKKILLLLISMFLLSGCSANYYMEIYDDTITEEYTINFESEEVGDSDPLEYANSVLYENIGSLEDTAYRQFENLDDGLGIKASNSYNFKEFDKFDFNLLSLRQCYNVINFSSNTKYISIITADEFKCYEIFDTMESLSVNIKSNHKMIENNADSVKDNTYTWNISKYNADNKPIKIKFAKDKYVFNYNGEFTKKIIYIGAIMGIILVIGLSIKGYFNHKNKEANKI